MTMRTSGKESCESYKRAKGGKTGSRQTGGQVKVKLRTPEQPGAGFINPAQPLNNPASRLGLQDAAKGQAGRQAGWQGRPAGLSPDGQTDTADS